MLLYSGIIDISTGQKEAQYLISHRCWLIHHNCHHPDQYDLILRTSVPWLLQLANVSKELANKDKNKDKT